MDKETLLQLMNADLANEFKHLHFYLQSSVTLEGPWRHEIGEYLFEESQSELVHCQEFAKMIVWLGGSPTDRVEPYPTLTQVRDILEHVLLMEQNVVQNYHQRLQQIAEMDASWATALGLFYEDQLSDSFKTVVEVQQMLKGL